LSVIRNKFKTEESLTRKLVDKSERNLQKLWQAAKTVNDVLRYTFVLPRKVFIEQLKNFAEQVIEFPNIKSGTLGTTSEAIRTEVIVVSTSR